ncbi:MAG: hypothetical protein HQK53_19620, partial [Oligoflexia bacterium]|nr:hypothetical protein [Oligoflexia bacterium]
ILFRFLFLSLSFTLLITFNDNFKSDMYANANPHANTRANARANAHPNANAHQRPSQNTTQVEEDDSDAKTVSHKYCVDEYHHGKKTLREAKVLDTQIKRFDKQLPQNTKESPFSIVKVTKKEEVILALEKLKDIYIEQIEEAYQDYKSALACQALEGLTSYSTEDAPEAGEENVVPKSSMMGGMMMGGMAGGAQAGGGMAAAGGANPMMSMMMSGSLVCKSSGPQTQDYHACKRFINAYDAIVMAQMVSQQVDQGIVKAQQLEAQKAISDPNAVNTNTLALEQQKKQLESASVIAYKRASEEATKSAVLGGMGAAIPTKDSLMKKCSGIVDWNDSGRQLTSAMGNYLTRLQKKFDTAVDCVLKAPNTDGGCDGSAVAGSSAPAASSSSSSTSTAASGASPTSTTIGYTSGGDSAARAPAAAAPPAPPAPPPVREEDRVLTFPRGGSGP